MMFRARLILIAGLWLISGVPTYAQVREEVDDDTVQIRGEPVGPQDLNLETIRQRVAEQTNAFRKEHDLSQLEISDALQAAAERFAGFMAQNDLYGHRADGRRPAERAEEEGYEYCVISENIAYAFRSTRFEAGELVQKFVRGWKQSPPHRKNMLDPDVLETGIGMAHSQDSGHYYAVQLFGRPRSAAISFELTNDSDQLVKYKLAEREFSLPPRYTRTHSVCRPSELTVNLAPGQTQDEERGAADSESPEPEQREAKLWTAKPESGAQLVITGTGQELTVKQQR